MPYAFRVLGVGLTPPRHGTPYLFISRKLAPSDTNGFSPFVPPLGRPLLTGLLKLAQVKGILTLGNQVQGTIL